MRALVSIPAPLGEAVWHAEVLIPQRDRTLRTITILAARGLSIDRATAAIPALSVAINEDDPLFEGHPVDPALSLRIPLSAAGIPVGERLPYGSILRINQIAPEAMGVNRADNLQILFEYE